MFNYIKSLFSIPCDNKSANVEEFMDSLESISDFALGEEQSEFREDIYDTPDLSREFESFQKLKEYLDFFCIGDVNDEKSYKGFSYVIKRSKSNKSKTANKKYILQCCKGGRCRSSEVKFRYKLFKFNKHKSENFIICTEILQQQKVTVQ